MKKLLSCIWRKLPRCWYFEHFGWDVSYTQYYIWFMGKRIDIWRRYKNG